MTKRPLAVLGSCVSRDTVEFAANIEVALYCARQSIAAMGAPRLRSGILGELTFPLSIGAFHQRAIEQDVTKSSLNDLRDLPNNIPVLIDLIEERAPLGRSPCGSLVTLSEAAKQYSNLPDMVTERIRPWSAQHMALFDAALPLLSLALRGHPVVILRAFYAEDKRSFPKINTALEQLYDQLAIALPWAHVVEPSADLRQGEDGRKRIDIRISQYRSSRNKIIHRCIDAHPLDSLLELGARQDNPLLEPADESKRIYAVKALLPLVSTMVDISHPLRPRFTRRVHWSDIEMHEGELQLDTSSASNDLPDVRKTLESQRKFVKDIPRRPTGRFGKLEDGIQVEPVLGGSVQDRGTYRPRQPWPRPWSGSHPANSGGGHWTATGPDTPRQFPPQPHLLHRHRASPPPSSDGSSMAKSLIQINMGSLHRFRSTPP